MIRDVVIGTVTGISAVVAMSVMTPRPQPPPPAIRSVPAFGQGRDDLALPLSPTTRPDPARARLETVIEKLTSRGSGIKDVLGHIASATGANMVVNWRALESAGIATDAPVTLDLRRLPARVVLDQVLAQVGGGTIKLSHRAIDGIIVVTTADDLDRYRVTRVYDVRDLIAGPDGLDGLMKLVAETTQHVTWREPAGAIGGIRSFNGRLVITDSLETHERTAELLRGLRAKP
jgi:hypothetical protein